MTGLVAWSYEYEHVYEGMCRQAVQGAVYRNELLAADKENRICRVPYDASKPVDTFWDLGYFDNVAIWLAQSVGFELGMRVAHDREDQVV